jgi:hypothetical protein
MPYAMPHAAHGSFSTPWVSIVCYVFAVLCLVGVLVSFVMLLVGVVGKREDIAGMGLATAIATLPGGCLTAFFFYLVGKLFSKLEEILSAVRR